MRFLVGICILVCSVASGADSDAKLRTKEFVVMGYEGLLSDLRAGDGHYLKTLTDLLGVDPSLRSDKIQDIQKLSKQHSNIMDFADAVCALQNNIGIATAAVLPPLSENAATGEKLEETLNHLARGMSIKITTKTGAQFSGKFDEYNLKRLWMRTESRKSFKLDELLAVEILDH